MSMNHHGDPYVLVDAVAVLFPVERADAVRVDAAATCVGELVRFLNHATFSGRTLPQAADVSAVVGSLTSATRGLPQLLTQLTSRVENLAEEPGVYTTATSRGGVASQLGTAVQALREATARFAAAGAWLNEAHQTLSTIGHDDPVDTADPQP